MPAYATALLVVLFSGATILFQTSSAKKAFVAGSIEIKRDTVFITRTDTIFKERIIYQQPKFTSLPKVQVNKAQERAVPAENGVSMKEKDELNKLLVSGSE